MIVRMNCRKVSHLISAYADGELPGVEHQAVHEHLKACECCRQEYDEVVETKRWLGAMPLPMPREQFLASLQNSMQQEAETLKRPAPVSQQGLGIFRVPQSLALAGIAAIAVFAVTHRAPAAHASPTNDDEVLEAMEGTVVVPLRKDARFTPLTQLFHPFASRQQASQVRFAPTIWRDASSMTVSNRPLTNLNSDLYPVAHVH